MSAALAKPPEPPANPLVGHLAPIARDPLARLTRYAREYGDVVKLRLLHLPAVLVSHPRLVEQVLVTRAALFAKSVDLRETRMLLGDGLLTSEGEPWRRSRRAMQPAFHQQRIAAYSSVITRAAEEIAGRWRDGETRDLRPEMTRLTLRAVTQALFGAELASEEDEIGRATDALFRLFDVSSASAYLLPSYLPTPIHLRALVAMRRLNRVVEGIIAARKSRGRRGDDLLGMLLEMTAGENGSGERLVRDQLMTLLIAGHETTSAGLTWLWYLLATHPEVDRRLEAELRTVLGERPAEYGDLARLPYTGRVVSEAMRLYPPAWMTGREAREDTELGGFAIPRGTTVYLSQWVVHRDPRFYDDAARFDPNRWTEAFARALPPFAYFPFGGGPRMCIGASFARAETILALATIARRFRFSLEPATRPIPYPSVTLRPRDGLPVTIHRRVSSRPPPAPDAIGVESRP